MTDDDRSERRMRKVSGKKPKAKTPAGHSEAMSTTKSRGFSVSHGSSEIDGQGVVESHSVSITRGRSTKGK